jgi:hypothetical protein
MLIIVSAFYLPVHHSNNRGWPCYLVSWTDFFRPFAHKMTVSGVPAEGEHA